MMITRRKDAANGKGNAFERLMPIVAGLSLIVGGGLVGYDAGRAANQPNAAVASATPKMEECIKPEEVLELKRMQKETMARVKNDTENIRELTMFIGKAGPGSAPVRLIDLRAAEWELQKMFNVKDVDEIPKNFESMLKIFDRIALTQYTPGDPKQPADMLAEDVGDCKDRASTLALMLNMVFPDSTRLVSAWNGSKGHAYAQFNLASLPGCASRWELENMINREFMPEIVARYGIGKGDAYERLLEGLKVGDGVDLEKMKYVMREAWLTLDATIPLPGGSDAVGFRVSHSIDYPDSTTMNELLRGTSFGRQHPGRSDMDGEYLNDF